MATRCDQTFQSITDALREYEFPVPESPMNPTGINPQVTIFVFPNNLDNGALEDICLASVADDPIINCVDDYFACVRGLQKEEHPHLSKAKVQVYLAKEKEGDIHMGTASRKNIWNWDSDTFNQVKEFIELI